MKKITDCYGVIMDFIWTNGIKEDMTLGEFIDLIEIEIKEEEKINKSIDLYLNL